MSTPETSRGSWWRQHKVVLTVIAALVLAVVIWRLVSAPSGKRSSESNAVAVVTATVRQAPFTVYQTAVGTVTPLSSVTLRSRVTGRLVSVAFHGGEMVKRGAVLAQIDPQPFQIKLDSAAGELARDQASSANLADTLKRYRQLLAEKSITPQQVADQQTLASQNAANVSVARSRVADAKLQLAYTRITAPIDGMVGLPRVDPGNVVDASDPAGITTVTQLHPISVVFAVPGDALAGLVRRLQAGETIPVAVYLTGSETELARGRLLAANNQIDADTGTVKLKAEFTNAEGALFPNQFVTVKLPVQTLARAVLVPTAAIQQGTGSTFVFVLGKDHKVSIAQVKLGPADGTTTVVAAGISPGMAVVIEGTDQLRDGMQVQPVATPATPLRSSTADQNGKGASAYIETHEDDPNVRRADRSEP